MNNIKINKTTSGIAIIFLIFGAVCFISFMPGHKAGVIISCSDGEIVGFRKPIGPPFCVGCQPTCIGEIKITLDNGILVCNNEHANIGLGSTTENERVIVPCDQLPEYKGQKLTITAKVSSDFGNYSTEKVLTYE